VQVRLATFLKILMNSSSSLASIADRVRDQTGDAHQIATGKNARDTDHWSGIDDYTAPPIDGDLFRAIRPRKRGRVKTVSLIVKALRIFSANFIAASARGWTFHEKSQLIGQ
jgi:hypothetical protein